MKPIGPDDMPFKPRPDNADRPRFPLRVGGKVLKCRGDGPVTPPVRDVLNEYGAAPECLCEAYGEGPLVCPVPGHRPRHA